MRRPTWVKALAATGISQAVRGDWRGRPCTPIAAAVSEHNSCLNSQRSKREGEREGRSCVCGERATVASAAIVFPAPVAGAPLPSFLPFLSFFPSFLD